MSTRLVRLSICVLVALGVGVVLAAPPSSDPLPRTIRLKSGEFDPLDGLPQAASAVPRIQRYEQGERGAFLIQFERPIGDADLSALRQAGASIKGYVPMMTLEVMMTEGERAKVAALPGVRWVGLHQPEFKIYPGLLARLEEPGAAGELTRLQVSLYPGEEEPALTRIAGLGGRVLDLDRGSSFAVATVAVPRGRTYGLAQIPQVRFIEEVYQPEEHNDRSRDLTGLTDVANDDFSAGLDPSLDGKDEGSGFQVKYGHFDGGLYLLQPDFSEPDVTLEPGSDSGDLDSGHGTHTAASIVGDGGQWANVTQVPPGSSGISAQKWRGVTPQAALHHISFENNYSDRQIFERESEVGAHISSNSWGYVDGVGSSIRDYNTNAATWDEGVWDADDDAPGLQPLIVFFSAGNNGGWVDPNGCNSAGGDNIGSPGTAKNVITVGNSETDRGSGCTSNGQLGDDPETVNASSSRGPVDPDGSFKGLFKPDVVNVGGYYVMSAEAPNTGGGGPDNVFDCSNTGGSYRYMNGTSMSTPLTAGLGGVLLQDLVVNRGVAEPRPSLMKALLINGARDLQPTNCDYVFGIGQFQIHEGWGFVQAKSSLYGPGGSPATRNVDFENEVTDNAVATAETYTRQITVSPGAPLKVTLVWTDYPASPGSGSPLVVNDLDLQVSGPDGTFRGNNFIGNWSVTGGNADRYNVVENVYIENPIGGTYTVSVSGFQVTQDREPDKTSTNQDFSLVWSGALSPQASCGDGSCTEGETGCDCPEDCGAPPASELVCDDGGDDDCDGSTDCADPDCAADVFCIGSCGDGTCGTGEDCLNCDLDCISSAADCGDGVCETALGEDCSTCPGDCNAVTEGPPRDRFCCGQDVGCEDARCNSGGFRCSDATPEAYCCGDGSCNGDETIANCAIDCTVAAGAVPGASATPLIVMLNGSGDVELSWAASCLTSDDDYAIYEGSMGSFTSHAPRMCTTGGATAMAFPPPTDSVYFLVVPHNGSREGSYGLTGAGMERPASASACLPQEVGVCLP